MPVGLYDTESLRGASFARHTGEMGKSRKRIRHMNTGYPYSPIHAHIHVVRPRMRHAMENGVGLYMEATHSDFGVVPHDLGSREASKLKRLQFVEVYGGYAWDKANTFASSVYRGGRACLPAAVEPPLRVVEDKVAEVTGAVITTVQARSYQVLRIIDVKVDTVLVQAHGLLCRAQGLHEVAEADSGVGFESMYHARADYVQKHVDMAMEYLKAAGLGGANKTAGSAWAGPSKEEKEAELMMHRLGDAWAKLLDLPPVSKALETAQPSVQFTQRKYLEAHHAIVASAAYTRALEAAATVVAKVTESALYRGAVMRLYPVISPYADPALDKITHSPYYSAVVDHLKPAGEHGASSLAAGPSPRSWHVLSCAQC